MSTQTESAFYLPNKLRRCGRYESIFYGAYAGEGATFDIRVRFDFKQKVNLPRFQAAANKALEAYPEFAVRPVLYQGRVCYEENHASVALLPDNGVQRCFGTEDTNGYLFLFLYGERHVTFSLFHSQTDAHGLICYVITVMWRYLTSLFPPARLAGANLLNRGGVRTDSSRFNAMQDTERFDP
ncbi:hypothetical protein, partial [Methanobrevibacter gottschalkii]|uniref:hypothetical protein n=1 Tax=Methanobrevibacter gottschalkii TaxID=190974 RepID=UPI0038D12285